VSPLLLCIMQNPPGFLLSVHCCHVLLFFFFGNAKPCPKIDAAVLSLWMPARSRWVEVGGRTVRWKQDERVEKSSSPFTIICYIYVSYRLLMGKLYRYGEQKSADTIRTKSSNSRRIQFLLATGNAPDEGEREDVAISVQSFGSVLSL
jgi:hypothetical protein